MLEPIGGDEEYFDRDVGLDIDTQRISILPKLYLVISDLLTVAHHGKVKLAVGRHRGRCRGNE